MLNIARSGGNKKPVITSTRDRQGERIVMALNETQKVETILAVDGLELVSDEYLRLLIELSHEKLRLARAKFEQLRFTIERRFCLNEAVQEHDEREEQEEHEQH